MSKPIRLVKHPNGCVKLHFRCFEVSYSKNASKKLSYLCVLMKNFRYILPLFLLVISSIAFCQKQEKVLKKDEGVEEADKKKFSKQRRQSSQSLLEAARAQVEKSPANAIKLVEEALLYARKEGDQKTEAEAYILLANIYEDIDQKELALQRYEQALAVLNRSKDGGQAAPIHHRMGQLQLALKSDKEAEISFTRCVELSFDKALKQRCEEGLADVELLRGNADASFSKLDDVERNYRMDSVSTARLEAKRSNVYLQQNDFPNASESYLNSINSLPKNAPIPKEDYAAIEQAQQQLLSYNAADSKNKIEIASKSAAKNLPSEASNDQVILGNLKVAAVYEEEEKLTEAGKFIARSKSLINEETDAAISADVYKKSAELNRKRGNLPAVLADMELYIQKKEQALQNLQNELVEQVEIVKGQKQIDVGQKDFDLEEKDKVLLQSQLNTQKIIIGLLSLLLLASLVFFYFLYKNVKARRKAHQRLLLKSLRTQMNPHFIFNALNSVNNFISKSDEMAANKFLTEFSRLMRKVLDYSQKDFISFEEELELNELYLRLEHFRFRDKFNYQFQNNARLHGTDLEVPPMLIQPFIENAVWHGLRYKEASGNLEVLINEDERHITVTIKDDSIGRTKSKALKTENQKKYKSAGLENVSKRIALINEIYDKNYEISVTDVDSNATETGTLVTIKIPLN